MSANRGSIADQDGQKIREGLLQLARETRTPHTLPGASELWWRAEIIRRWVTREEAAREAERPLVWSRSAGFVLALLALASLLASQSPGFMVVLLACGLAPVTALLAWLFLQKET